jgi:hypothetical protein
LLRGEFRDGGIRVRESDAVFDEIPMIQQIESLLSTIDPQTGFKLTQAGYLPVATVKTLYTEAPAKDQSIEAGIPKLRLETECEPVHLTRIISELSGYLRKQHGRLFVTRKGKAFREQPEILSTLLTVFGEKFDMGYLDGYGLKSIGNVGYGYSLYLLSKYGSVRRPAAFYAERYFRAFPQLRSDDQGRDRSCYAIRTFSRFLRYFGFVSDADSFTRPPTIQKTDVMDRFVEILP